MKGEPEYRGRPYAETERGLWWFKPTQDGRSPVMLANFTARVIADVIVDDGTETQRAFKIEAAIGQERKTVFVPATQFAAMNWPTEQLGIRAIVYPNQKDHARVAIQQLSKDPPEQRRFQHTGWRELDGQRVYIHAGGAIGPRGGIETIETQFSPAMQRYFLPSPSRKPEIVAAVRASLSVFDGLAPDHVIFPLYSAIWRSILGETTFSLHLSGLTGTGKSELAALIQQHFGKEMTASRLPASWISTANALEALAFQAKDAILTVDDFVPLGNASDQQRLHRDADRLLRAQGNTAGRQRMTSEAHVKPAKPPRGIILSTGEELPRGQSLRARMVCIELAPKDLNFQALTGCQRAAAEGVYSLAAAGFIRWLSVNWATAHKALERELFEFRQQQEGQEPSAHRRTPDNLCNLGAGLKIFFDFAVRSGAIQPARRDELWARATAAFEALIVHQERSQATADPARGFVALIPSVLSSGAAHVAGIDGKPPDNPAAFGWRQHGQEWRPNGPRIGWYDPSEAALYLEPATAYNQIVTVSRESGDALTLSLSTLKRRLKQANLLASTDEARQTATIRRKIEGAVREVLHILPGGGYQENPTSTTFTTPETAPADPNVVNVGFQKAKMWGNPTLPDVENTGETTSNVGNVVNVGFPTHPPSGRKSPSSLIHRLHQWPRKKTEASGAPPNPEGYPLTLEAVNQFFPGTLDSFIRDLVQSVSTRNGAGAPDDQELAEAVVAAYKPKAQSRGWFLATTYEALSDLRAHRAVVVEPAAGSIYVPKCGECGDSGVMADEHPQDGWSAERVRAAVLDGHAAFCNCEQGLMWKELCYGLDPLPKSEPPERRKHK